MTTILPDGTPVGVGLRDILSSVVASFLESPLALSAGAKVNPSVAAEKMDTYITLVKSQPSVATYLSISGADLDIETPSGFIPNLVAFMATFLPGSTYDSIIDDVEEITSSEIVSSSVKSDELSGAKDRLDLVISVLNDPKLIIPEIFKDVHWMGEHIYLVILGLSIFLIGEGEVDALFSSFPKPLLDAMYPGSDPVSKTIGTSVIHSTTEAPGYDPDRNLPYPSLLGAAPQLRLCFPNLYAQYIALVDSVLPSLPPAGGVVPQQGLQPTQPPNIAPALAVSDVTQLVGLMFLLTTDIAGFEATLMSPTVRALLPPELQQMIASAVVDDVVREIFKGKLIDFINNSSIVLGGLSQDMKQIDGNILRESSAYLKTILDKRRLAEASALRPQSVLFIDLIGARHMIQAFADTNGASGLARYTNGIRRYSSINPFDVNQVALSKLEAELQSGRQLDLSATVSGYGSLIVEKVYSLWVTQGARRQITTSALGEELRRVFELATQV